MAFQPSDLSGLELWLKADAGVFKDAGITPAVNGDTVQQWNDQSGIPNNAKQATANNRPTYMTNRLNGLPVIVLNNANPQGFDCDNPNNFDITTPTIFVVGRGQSASGSFTSKNTTSRTDAGRRKLQISIADSTHFTYSSGADGSNDTILNTMNNFNIMAVVVHADASHKYFSNNTETDTTTALGDSTVNTGANANLEIGFAFNNGAEAITGEIAEVIIYNRELTTIEYQSVIDYLANKWKAPQKVDTFTASGNWTCPAGVTSVLVECIGGGGAGGGSTVNTDGGGGGAGGQYARKVVPVVPGTVYAIVVGGTQAGTTGNGTAGNDSTFAATTVVAKGGAGGIANNGAGGVGATTSGVGDTVFAGGSGSAGAASTRSGGGGGGAGSLGAGGSTTASTTGGTGTVIGGGSGATGLASGSNANGNAGNNYGGGGSGAYRTTTTSRSGGTGAQGIVYITYPVPPLSNKVNQIGQAVNRSNTY